MDDQGNKFIEYGKVESNRPMFDAKPVVQEKADGSEFSDISRPWDDWNEWEHRSAFYLSFCCTLFSRLKMVMSKTIFGLADRGNK